MYKLVQQIDNQYFSYVKTSNVYHIEYKINEFVYPKIGKLFVFEDVESAKKFWNFEYSLGADQNIKIFKCEVLGEPEKPKSIGSTYMDLKNFWDEIKNTNYPVYSKSPPDGTLLVDAVKITEEVIV